MGISCGEEAGQPADCMILLFAKRPQWPALKESARRSKFGKEMPAHLLDARKRPSGRLGDQRFGGNRKTLERANSPVLGRAGVGRRIAERDASIPHQAAPFCAFDGTSPKNAAEFFFAHPGKPFKARHKQRFFVVFFRGGRGEFSRLTLSGHSKASWLKLLSLR